MSCHRTIIRLWVVLAALALAWACGGDNPTAPPTPEPVRPATVTVSPATADLTALGATVQLTAEVRDQNARVMAGATVTWSSGDTSVATVDASGLVTAVGNGTATITATAGSAWGSTTVTVVESPDRAALVALYEATEGPNWVNSENWLTDAPLGDWYGVDTDGSGRVVALNLAGNTDHWPDVTPHGLEGPIPPEIGSLAHMQWLDLDDNALTGPIPPEIGSLGSLEGLDLDNNALSGPVPPELGNLVNLVDLDLTENDLTGPIPQSLLNLTKLRRFYFQGNEGLCAPGVAGFADWLGAMEDTSGPYCNEADVEALELLFETAGGTGWTRADGWRASHALEEWHGVTADTLGQVEALDLGGNGLAGEMPDWPRGALAHMTELRIGANAGLAGRLPLSLADLSLRVLHYAGTGLCAPADAAFTRWLNAVSSHQGTGVECAPHTPARILIPPDPVYDSEIVLTGTVWESADIITAVDPSALKSIEYVGRDSTNFHLNNHDSWSFSPDPEAFHFQAHFIDAIMDIYVHSIHGDSASAQKTTEVIVPATGRLPHIFLDGVIKIGYSIPARGALAGASPCTNVYGWHSDLQPHPDDDASTNRWKISTAAFAEEVALHEGVHNILEGCKRSECDDVQSANCEGLARSKSAEWKAAQDADGLFITAYARNSPNSEDMAESFWGWFVSRCVPERMHPEYKRRIDAGIPNRLAYFDALRLDMRPFECA